MSREPDSAFRSSTCSRWFLAVLFLLVVNRCWLALDRLYDPDEFEHLHAGYSLARGEWPYRDYFEHHGPATYWLSASLWRLLPGHAVDDVDPLTALTAHRLVILASELALWWVIMLTFKALHRPGGAVIAMVWLVTCPGYLEKSIEYRPDVFATLSVALAAYCCVLNSTSIRVGGLWIDLVAGLCAGLSCLFTLKVLGLLAGLAIAALLSPNANTKHSPIPRLLAAAVGFTIPWGLTIGVLASQDAFLAFVRCAIEGPARWPTRVTGINPLWATTQWAPLHQATAAWGLVVSTRRWTKSRTSRTRTFPWFLPIATHASMLAVIPAVYLQFYLPALPLLAILVAEEIVETATLTRPHRRWFLFGGLALATIAAGLVARSELRSNTLGIFMLDANRWSRTNLYMRVDIVAIGLTLVSSLIWLCVRLAVKSQGGIACLLVIAAMALPSVGRTIIPSFAWSGARQRRDLALVRRQVAPGEKVLDGFTGLAFFRPHAWYWFWVNEHTRPMIHAEHRELEFSNLINRATPSAILVDIELLELTPSLGEWTEGRYQASTARLESVRAALLLKSPDK